jgi:hypothetical protein
MLSHLLTYFAESLVAGARPPMLRFDFLSFVAIIVIVMTLANSFRVFLGIGVIKLCHLLFSTVEAKGYRSLALKLENQQSVFISSLLGGLCA